MSSTAIRRALASVPVVALVLLYAGGVAAAHEAAPTVRTVIDRVEPSVPGLTIRIEAGVATQLVVENQTDTEVEVLGADGRPFIRVGPEGVFGNRNVPDWHVSGTPSGGLPVPAEARDPEALPSWFQVSTDPVWGWFDHRLHPETIVPAESLAEAAEAVRLADWEVPLRHGDTVITVNGYLEYVPVFGSVLALLDAGEEPFPGVTLAVSQGRVPVLFLDNTTPDPVLVRGREGEPFLRIGPDGTEGNAHSPSFADDQRSRGLDVVGVVDPSAAPEWVPVAGQPRYGWLESRAAYGLEQPPEAVVSAGVLATLQTWRIPLEQAEEVAEATGRIVWAPREEALAELGLSAQEPGPSSSWLSSQQVRLGAVVVFLALAGGLWWRPRRRRSTRPSETSG